MSEKEQSILNSIKALGQQVLPPGSKLILYGSRARGEACDDSDWDLLIIADTDHFNTEDYDNIVFPFTALGWDLNQLVIPVAYTKQEWESSSFTLFYHNVKQDGIVLV